MTNSSRSRVSCVLVCVLVLCVATIEVSGQYKVSFDMTVIGCRSTTENSNGTSQSVATLEINNAYYRKMYLYHELRMSHYNQSSCQLSQSFSFDFPAPPEVQVSFVAQFRWLTSEFLSDVSTCCWSVYNVKTTHNNISNSVGICNDQHSYIYNNSVWVCPNSGSGKVVQFSSNILLYNVSKSGSHYKRVNIHCRSDSEPSVAVVKYSEWRLSNMIDNECGESALFNSNTKTLSDLYYKILSSPSDGLNSLSTNQQITREQVMFLMSVASNASGNDSSQAFEMNYINMANDLIADILGSETTDSQSRSELFQAFQELDNFALNNVNPSGQTVVTKGFYMNVQNVEASQKTNGYVLGINNEGSSISLPSEMFNESTVRVASFLFPNLSHLLPPLDTNSSIISPIISSTINCQSCPVTDLIENVKIDILIKNRILPSNENVECVFLDLQSGDWNTSGCTTTVNGDLVSCSCNHLTHFAVKLSPAAGGYETKSCSTSLTCLLSESTTLTFSQPSPTPRTSTILLSNDFTPEPSTQSRVSSTLVPLSEPLSSPTVLLLHSPTIPLSTEPLSLSSERLFSPTILMSREILSLSSESFFSPSVSSSSKPLPPSSVVPLSSPTVLMSISELLSLSSEPLPSPTISLSSELYSVPLSSPAVPFSPPSVPLFSSTVSLSSEPLSLTSEPLPSPTVFLPSEPFSLSSEPFFSPTVSLSSELFSVPISSPALPLSSELFSPSSVPLSSPADVPLSIELLSLSSKPLLSPTVSLSSELYSVPLSSPAIPLSSEPFSLYSIPLFSPTALLSSEPFSLSSEPFFSPTVSLSIELFSVPLSLPALPLSSELFSPSSVPLSSSTALLSSEPMILTSEPLPSPTVSLSTVPLSLYSAPLSSPAVPLSSEPFSLSSEPFYLPSASMSSEPSSVVPLSSPTVLLSSELLSLSSEPLPSPTISLSSELYSVPLSSLTAVPLSSEPFSPSSVPLFSSTTVSSSEPLSFISEPLPSPTVLLSSEPFSLSSEPFTVSLSRESMLLTSEPLPSPTESLSIVPLSLYSVPLSSPAVPLSSEPFSPSSVPFSSTTVSSSEPLSFTSGALPSPTVSLFSEPFSLSSEPFFSPTVSLSSEPMVLTSEPLPSPTVSLSTVLLSLYSEPLSSAAVPLSSEPFSLSSEPFFSPSVSLSSEPLPPSSVVPLSSPTPRLLSSEPLPSSTVSLSSGRNSVPLSSLSVSLSSGPSSPSSIPLSSLAVPFSSEPLLPSSIRLSSPTVPLSSEPFLLSSELLSMKMPLSSEHTGSFSSVLVSLSSALPKVPSSGSISLSSGRQFFISITPSSETSFVKSSSVPLPTSILSVDVVCSFDGVWPQSLTGTNVTLSTGVKECFNGTVEAVRLCSFNGTWGAVHCVKNSIFTETLNQVVSEPLDGLKTLSTVVGNELSLPQSVFLLDMSLNSLIHSISDEDTDTQEFVENFLAVSSRIITSTIDNISNADDDGYNEETKRSVGSQLLQSLDNLALTLVEPSEEVIEFGGSFLKVSEVVEGTTVVGIRIDNNFITLPKIIFEEATIPVRVASFLFPNLSHLLPPLDTNSSIISPIISSTINCQSCPIADLTENVTVQLQLQSSVESDEHVSCVFYDFISQDGLLPSGNWSTSGCTTTVNGDIVTCSCNHLTHFAILLSPGGPKISAIHPIVLNTIGLVLVPISLICMVLVVLTYTLIRSLWSMYGYVHIMLCASLFMAQLVFIVGVDKIENQDACSVVTVIMLYLFLVTFMWMLMEGVVLYVTLIIVFITNHRNYIIAFTVASYGMPAVYLAIITPIGYLVNAENHSHFLYYSDNSTLTACWLNYSTGFVWSFIAPVIVIILINIGFFIMSVMVMRKHTNKMQKSKFKIWLSFTITLTVVMGIAWLGGLLAFRRELLPVLYIITIFIAAQGIIIFIVLVPLSKQVREAYYRAWVVRRSRSQFLSKMSDKMSYLSYAKSTSISKFRKLTQRRRKHAAGTGRVGGIVLGTFHNPVVQEDNGIKQDLDYSFGIKQDHDESFGPSILIQSCIDVDYQIETSSDHIHGKEEDVVISNINYLESEVDTQAKDTVTQERVD